jgi:hypothetical protein
MNITQRNQLYRKLHAMLNELGIAHSKSDILASYGVNSIRQLTDSELINMVNRVQDIKLQKSSTNTRLRQLRSRVLTILNQMGIYVSNNDWQHVNAFLLDKRIAGKLLYELTVDELECLMPKLRSIAAKFREKQELEKHLMLNN